MEGEYPGCGFLLCGDFNRRNGSHHAGRALPKQKPEEDISEQLRPTPLTPAILKLAEDFVVSTYVGPALLKINDRDQYGGIPKSSFLFTQISMFHHWSHATDGTGAAVRVVFLD